MHKLIAGDGYLYLTRHVATADVDTPVTVDAAAYYTAEGNPPGVWLGRGAAVLGLTGTRVREDQMRNLFGTGAHPEADAMRAAFLAEHARPGMTGRQVRELVKAAERHAHLGRQFAEYKALAPLTDRVAERVNALEQETGRDATVAEVSRIRQVESRRAAGAVAGFDLVFAPVKSVALVWALDARAEVRAAIREAHEQAMAETIALLEQHAAHTRTGAGGLAQIDTTGLVAVAFTHHDSRAGDPNLHTHVAVSNKIQGVDGVWRALDARGLHAMTVAASEHYNTRLQAHVTAALGVAFEARQVERGKQAVMEIAGIDHRVVEHFSRRRAQVESRYDRLVAEYRAAHGRDPDPKAAYALARTANLATRQSKAPIRSLNDMRASWRDELAREFGTTAMKDVARAVPGHPTTHRAPLLPKARRAEAAARAALDPAGAGHRELVDSLAGRVVAAVGNERSTWTVWNLRAQTERILRDPVMISRHRLDLASPAQTAALAQEVTDRAAGPGMSISVEAPALVPEPPSLRRADGESVFTRHGAARHTSQAVLDAEHRLLTAATVVPKTGVPAPTRAQVEAAITRFQTERNVTLDAGQAAVVAAFAADPRTLVVGLGPAGTGKTTAMRALKAVLDQTGTGRLIPLATSAHAAAVLTAELGGVRAENVHKFLWDHQAGSPRRIRLRPGDVVLVDEAGMAGTPNLDRILALAQTAGARVRLLGDDRQLSAVESGGALRLLAEQAGAVELDVVHRFADPAEAAATLQLRVGDHRGLEHYQRLGRIRGGSAQEMTEAAYRGWLIDMQAGKTSLLATTTTADVTRLSARARADRVEAGQVENTGVLLHDGNLAGVGDWIVTRANDRRLTNRERTAWVRNGDAWTVVHRTESGALTVAHLQTGARLALPADYVTANVELLYATTAHRVQGGTVDTTHALITPEATREHAYVLGSRARQATTFYVQTHEVLPVDEDARIDRRSWDPAGIDPAVILQRVLDRESAELSATETIRRNQEAAESLATLVPRHQHAVAVATRPYYEQIVDQVLTPADAAEARRDDAFDNLITELRRAHQNGWQPEQALARAVRYATAEHAADTAAAQTTPESDGEDGEPASDESWSITRHAAVALRDLAQEAAPPALHEPTREDVDRYAALLAENGITAPDHALTQARATVPAALRSPAFDAPAPAAVRRETTPTAYRQELLQLLPRPLAIAVLGDSDPVRRRALQLSLARAEHAGHHLSTVLTAPEVTGIAPITGLAAADLTRAITEHLQDHPEPAFTGPAARTPAATQAALTNIAWSLKALEETSHDLADVLAALPAPAPGPAGSGQSTPAVAAWLRVREAARSHGAERVEAVVPWAPEAVPGTVATREDADYLTALREAITARLAELRAGLDVTADAMPAWATGVFARTAGYLHVRPSWLDQTVVAAAFRDQYPPAIDDPAQPLGAFPEPAPHTDRPHARAHAAAAGALATAFDLAHPVGRDDTTGPDTTLADRHRATAHALATTTWHALDPAQKRAVAADVLARVGVLPTPADQPDHQTPAGPGQTLQPPTAPTVSGLDEALTAPETKAHLYRALLNRGHLDPVDDTPDTAPTTTIRPAAPVAPSAPAAPAVQPGYVVYEHEQLPDVIPGAPRPGIEEHRDIGRQHRY